MHPAIPGYISRLQDLGARVLLATDTPIVLGGLDKWLKTALPGTALVYMPAHEIFISAKCVSNAAGWEACLSRNDLP